MYFEIISQYVEKAKHWSKWASILGGKLINLLWNHPHEPSLWDCLQLCKANTNTCMRVTNHAVGLKQASKHTYVSIHRHLLRIISLSVSCSVSTSFRPLWQQLIHLLKKSYLLSYLSCGCWEFCMPVWLQGSALCNRRVTEGSHNTPMR